MTRTLKAEWWELWSVGPNDKPVLVRSDGDPIPAWIPSHGFPTKAGAEDLKRRRRCSYDVIIHVQRYAFDREGARK